MRGKVMTFEEKQIIVATARKLIGYLDSCDDNTFVDFVLDCVRRSCRTCLWNSIPIETLDSPCWNCKGNHSEWMSKEN